MNIIDPLKMKLEEMVIQGSREPLSLARQYGTESDIEKLAEIYYKIRPGIRRFIYIDLTPFERIGHDRIMVSKLVKIKENFSVIPVLMLMDTLFDYLSNRNENINQLLSILFNGKGKFVDIRGLESGNTKIQEIKKQIRKDFFVNDSSISSNLLNFRKIISEKILMDNLFESNSIEIPRLNHSENNISKSINFGGRTYIIMPNNMLVSCYLNLKNFGNNISFLTSTIYEIIIVVTEYFRRDIDVLNTFDCFVTTNNTALFLSSLLQHVLKKPLIAVDRLGPIPNINIHRNKLRKQLENKNIILIEEIVATGNELDRAMLFLNSMKTSVEKIITLYNLEVGRPMLIKNNQLISLCKPKEELKYVYRSK